MPEKHHHMSLSAARAKRLHRYFNTLVSHGDPNKLNSPEDVMRLICGAALAAAVSMYHTSAGLRSIGLAKTSELAAAWLVKPLQHREPALSEVPDALVEAVIADGTARAEVFELLRVNKAMGRKMERLLHDDPEELRGILAARLREARESAIEEVPRLFERIQEQLRGLQEQLDKIKEELPNQK